MQRSDSGVVLIALIAAVAGALIAGLAAVALVNVASSTPSASNQALITYDAR